MRSSVVWEQLKSKTGQTLINVVQHAQQLFVAVKQEVAAGRPSTKARCTLYCAGARRMGQAIRRSPTTVLPSGWELAALVNLRA